MGSVVLGGSEKLRGDDDYRVPVFSSLDEALEASNPEIVIDLSGEPVVDNARRFQLAAAVLSAGLVYVGADFRLEPVEFHPFEVPSLGVIGTGKRLGKTAVAGHIARFLAVKCDVIVVAMGRGGPREPMLMKTPPGLSDLLELSRSGYHAASDYLEDAALARVVTIGCRRCGEGLAGQPFIPNVVEGAALAASLEPDLVLFEGSGAAIPPMDCDRWILTVSAAQGPEAVVEYLGPYRLLLSDLVIATMCEEPFASRRDIERLRRGAVGIKDIPLVATVLRPTPAEPIRGRRVAYFSTAPDAIHDRLRGHLEDVHGAEIVLVSGNLADRAALEEDLDSPAARDADVYLVELKAAAVDVLVETATARGVPVILSDNSVVSLEHEPDLDALLLDLAPVPEIATS